MPRNLTGRQTVRLPPVSALLGFEAVARTRNIAAAARELCLTPSAVSKQLRELEDHLGCALFVRTTRSVVMTADGTEYLRAIAPLLSGIEDATLRLRTRSERDKQLDLGVPHSLGNRWLIPRLASFYDAHPDIHINLTTISGLPDLAAARLQYALAYCEEPPAGCTAEHALRLRLFPVISSRLATAMKSADWHEALRRYPLLEQVTLPNVWAAFLNKIGEDPGKFQFGARYQLLTMGHQAALVGLGIALLPGYVAAADVQAGRMVRLGEHYLDTPASYKLIRLTSTRKTAAMSAFASWVKQEGQRSESQELL